MDKRYNLNRIAYFVAVVEEGTVTAAAARLGISKAVVSKQLALLEEELGVALLLRNTRRLRPTEAGRTFYDRGKMALMQASEAFEAVGDHDGTPKGRLRVTATVGYGLAEIAPLVARYRARYPNVTVELTLSDQQFDLIEDRYDVAFRGGWLVDSSNQARKLGSFHEIPVCAPETVAGKTIESPDDLIALPFIANKNLPNPAKWRFWRGEEERLIELQTAISMNITSAIRQALSVPGCFAILPDFLLTDDLAAGTLVRLIPDWTLRTGGVYVVCPPGRVRASAVQAFLDMARKMD